MGKEISRDTAEKLLDEKYDKGYHVGEKMQSGVPMPEEPFDMCQYLATEHLDLYYIDDNGICHKR